MRTEIVIFRKDEFAVFALFPEIPHDRQGIFCTTYQHIGQHSGADYHHCIQTSKPASEDEYRNLATELRRVGYTLDIRKRASCAMRRQCRETARGATS